MNIYFGDLHNHCNISYGFGKLENALEEASEHLDFCTVTGHAHWPDIFRRTEETGFIIDFHKKGFHKLKKHWDEVRQTLSAANKEGEFITFQSYEMHSSKYGDHHFISPDDSLELIGGNSPGAVVSQHNTDIAAIPHHIAYTPGYRGIDWNSFNESISPVVEVYSKHGCGISEESKGEYLHTMGPRDGRNTVYSGLRAGKRFGFAASTDHHAGYPGSYGDGITAVIADRLDRQSIWNAIIDRRTYALTGDRIRCSFKVNGSHMGSFIKNKGKADVSLDISALGFIEKAVIYKNLEPVITKYREGIKGTGNPTGIYRIRIEVGWGRKNKPFMWTNKINIKKGKILSLDKCFRGQNVLAPKEGEEHSEDVNKMKNRAVLFNNGSVEWKCTTFKNFSTRHPSTNALVLEIQGGSDTALDLEFNGHKTSIELERLINNGISNHLKDFNSEAYLVHKAVPEDMYKMRLQGIIDTKPGDFIHAEVHQTNGQSAWISPVFIGKGIK